MGAPVATSMSDPEPAPMVLTPTVADPVGSMLATVPNAAPSIKENPNAAPRALDSIVDVCRHPALAIHTFSNGEKSYFCQRCAKTWPSLPDAIDEAEPTEPIHATEGNDVIPQAISEMASEMSHRIGQTLSSLVDATHPGSAVAMHQYEDFLTTADLVADTHYQTSVRANLRAQTPFVRPLPVRGGQMGEVFIETNPMRNAGASLREATREANEAMARRHKAMEDAARAAAAAFYQGLLDEAAPVKLEGDRKLKVVS